MLDVPAKARARLPEVIQAAGYAASLIWLNAYICREMFVRYTPRMNSMQGFWIAMSRLAGTGWFHSQWYRYWDCGSPVEFIYAPLVPAMTAWASAVRGVPRDVAFQTVSGLIYCLGPVTLFLMAWLLTRAPGYSFAASVFYSLTAPSQLFMADASYSIQHFWDARRLYLATVWDETPPFGGRGPDLPHIQHRQQSWVIVDVLGKHGRVRSVPVPGWAKAAIDRWSTAAGIYSGRVFRPINRGGR